ncbi:MAG TPA: glycosyltransferase [Bryobacteraceae bacterium]|nr:glycosyltransferase [Bryobacteraceae bacterium]
MRNCNEDVGSLQRVQTTDPSLSSDVPILIPAYQPGEPLVSLIDALLNLGVRAIVVINDGSGPESKDCLERIAQSDRVHILHHAVNLGKGAALKTGMNYALVRFPGSCGVVTADADGQHHPEDIVRIAQRLRENPDSLIMGARSFGSDVPLRSLVGNQATRVLMRLMVGQKLSDTQTGLRGIPATLIPHLLRVPSTGYEFELDMLIACKHQGYRIWQEPIRTIYLEGNRQSHFHPVLDSMRIYFLLLRFSVLSFLTAVIDNVAFALTFSATGSIGQSQAAARLIAMIFNYWGARRLVFHSRQSQAVVLPKYVLLVVCNGFLSYALIRLLHDRLGVRTIAAKLLAEGLLFIANFAIQRDFVFTRRETSPSATNWDSYYTSVPATAKLTRRYTTARLLDAIRRYVTPASLTGRISIVEIGGANSCFVDRILQEVPCGSYDVVDTNQYGLSLLAGRAGLSNVVRLHQQSVLALSLDTPADLVFSVGLIEHFDPARTREAVLAHFRALRPGGIAIITFPRPTLLYRITRGLIEMAGMWKFFDERPLDPEEVIATVRESGDVMYQQTLWPLFLTQQLIVARKRTSAQPGQALLA